MLLARVISNKCRVLCVAWEPTDPCGGINVDSSARTPIPPSAPTSGPGRRACAAWYPLTLDCATRTSSLTSVSQPIAASLSTASAERLGLHCAMPRHSTSMHSVFLRGPVRVMSVSSRLMEKSRRTATRLTRRADTRAGRWRLGVAARSLYRRWAGPETTGRAPAEQATRVRRRPRCNAGTPPARNRGARLYDDRRMAPQNATLIA